MSQKAWLFLVVAIFITFVFINRCRKPIDQPILDYNALKFSKDSLQSVNKAISMDYASFEAVHLAKEDSLTKMLQAAVSSKTISAAVISTRITSHDSGNTVVTVHDTIIDKDSLPCDPTFSFNKIDSAEEVHVKANKDSTNVSFLLFNKQTIESKFENSGFLGMGKKSIVLQVTNSNPKVRTTNQVSYVKPLPKANRVLWFLGGAAAGTFTYIYLKK